MRRILTGLLAFSLATAPASQAQEPASIALTAPSNLADRAAQLPAIIAGSVDLDGYFAPEFLAAVPPKQIRELTASLLVNHGAIVGLERIEPQDNQRATIYVRFEKSVGRFQMTIDPAQSGQVSGLVITGFTSNDESLAAIAAEIRALPGATHMLISRLGETGPTPLLDHNADTALAIGSTFKLYILAELADQVQRRKLGWERVTEVDRQSFSSKATENWPRNAPVTLHTLASWMISVSDNAATDILLDVLGRDAVGKRMTAIGNSVADRNLPFLNTVEAFALKSNANADLRAQFLRADEATQRRMLDTATSQLTLEAVTSEMFVGKPLYIDTIEWFASANDLARLMNHFRAPKLATARAIMAINPGVARDAAARWSYLGYKGGSEAGVISMSFLLQSKSGRWYAVTGSWNNVAAPVNNATFVGLMQRLVEQLAKDDAAKP